MSLGRFVRVLSLVAVLVSSNAFSYWAGYGYHGGGSHGWHGGGWSGSNWGHHWRGGSGNVGSVYFYPSYYYPYNYYSYPYYNSYPYTTTYYVYPSSYDDVCPLRPSYYDSFGNWIPPTRVCVNSYSAY